MAQTARTPGEDPLPTASEPRDTAIPKLVEAHAGRLFALSRGFCGNDEEARDVVQETFLKAWRSWEQFDGRSSVGTWLYRIAARTCGAMRRKRAGEPDALLPLDEAPGAVMVADEHEGPDAELVRDEGRARVERALAELPEEFRLPLELQTYAGLSLESVGRILDLPPATVKTRVFRAREKLRAAVEALPPEAAREEGGPDFQERLCLDFLDAAARAQEQGVSGELPLEEVCRRCAEVFAHADLGEDVCQHLGRRDVIEALRGELLAKLAAAG